MGIFREAMNPQILVEDQEELQLKELIDLVIVAISDKARKIGMNLLKNSCNRMIDNFRSIKWLFHELEEVKEKVGQMEGTMNLMSIEKGKEQDERRSLV